MMGRWKKGQSGNPRGRPKKGTSLAELFRATMDEVRKIKNPDTKRERTIQIKKAFVEAVLGRAISGSDAAAKLVLEHTEGKPVQKIEDVTPGVAGLSQEELDEILAKVPGADKPKPPAPKARPKRKVRGK